LLELAGRPEIPVVPGAVYPLLNSPERTKRWESLHGKLYYKGAWTEIWPKTDGVQRAPFHVPDVVPASPAGSPQLKPSSEIAANFLVRKVREFPGEVTIWAGGPLSNLALAARLDPEFARLARELVFMGGSFNPVPASNAFANEYLHNPRLEFNARWDAEAASMVVREPWRKITQVPVDPTTRTFFTKAMIQTVASGKALFAKYLEQFAQSFPMWDELAAAVWLDPTLVTKSETMLVDFDTSFTANYGTTLSWPIHGGPGLGERPVLVVQEVDVPRFERMVLSLLTTKK
jgi:inosine-uridine nucleoside N-ribohydrolase